MDSNLKQETENLRQAWQQYEPAQLLDYLVRDVQDPRINIQSILSRHFLIDRIFDTSDELSYLMAHEMRFALVANWVLQLRKDDIAAYEMSGLLDALFSKKNHSLNRHIPRYVSQTFDSLDLQNYICSLLTYRQIEDGEPPIVSYLMNTFQTIWRQVLEGQQAERISVIEPACGSANDWRFIDGAGFARFVDYCGFDLCDKNIQNAKSMFGKIDFRVDNALNIEQKDNAFDYCFTHDLFEHLSIEAMEIAIAETCRVTRNQMCIHFFNMRDMDQHVVEKTGYYHWNMLSCDKTKRIFQRYASKVEVIRIDSLLQEKFACSDTHNKDAYTFIVTI